MSATRPENGTSGDGGPADPGDIDARREPDVFTGVTSRLLGGPLAFGGLGWALDHWLGTAFLLPIGAIVGVALALYVVWLRYGTQ